MRLKTAYFAIFLGRDRVVSVRSLGQIDLIFGLF